MSLRSDRNNISVCIRSQLQAQLHPSYDSIPSFSLFLFLPFFDHYELNAFVPDLPSASVFSHYTKSKKDIPYLFQFT